MLIEKLIHNITQLSEWKQICIVWLSGLDASGKSQLWKELFVRLKELWKNSYYISWDAFHFGTIHSQKLTEKDWAHQHMKFSINHQKLRDDFLIPLKKLQKEIFVDTKCFDTWETSEKIQVSYPCIYVIESIYLFRSDMEALFDYKVFLEIEEQTCLERCFSRKRDTELYWDMDWIRKKYTTKNFPWYRLFMQQEKPKDFADIIIDNNNYNSPKIIYENPDFWYKNISI